MTKDTQPKTQATKPSQPSAEALEVAKKFFFTSGIETGINDVLIPRLAHIIDDAYRDREAGVAELSELLEAAREVAGTKVELGTALKHLEQAITKCEGSE